MATWEPSAAQTCSQWQLGNHQQHKPAQDALVGAVCSATLLTMASWEPSAAQTCSRWSCGSRPQHKPAHDGNSGTISSTKLLTMVLWEPSVLAGAFDVRSDCDHALP